MRSPAERRRTAALAGHEGDEVAARLAVGDPDPRTREVALGALARLGRLGREDLLAALADSAAPVRSRAVALAVPFPDVPLVPLLDDRDPAVAEQVAWALGERGGEAPGPVAAALSVAARRHPDPLVREAAVAALGALGHPGGLAAVLAATGDRPAVRRRAVLALAAFDGPEVDAALQRALGDRDRQVRQAAEDLLG